jgi:hypothetical protein
METTALDLHQRAHHALNGQPVPAAVALCVCLHVILVLVVVVVAPGPPAPTIPVQAFPSSIFRDKNRCGTGKSQSKWTACKRWKRLAH